MTMSLASHSLFLASPAPETAGNNPLLILVAAAAFLLLLIKPPRREKIRIKIENKRR